MAKAKVQNEDTRDTRDSGGDQDDDRLSRAQETHEARTVRDVDFQATGPLPNIESRPGYVQRWIRVAKGAESDRQNLYSATRRGWTPRSPETLPKSQQWLTVQREGLGGCIGTHDSVLMERSVEINQREAEVKRRERRALEGAVKHNLFSEYKGMGGAATGFTAPADQSQARVERGVPPIQDD